MWMEVCIYSVVANSQAGNIWVYVMTTQKSHSSKILKLGYNNLGILPENLARGLGSRREHWWAYVSVFVNTPKKLILKSIFP